MSIELLIRHKANGRPWAYFAFCRPTSTSLIGYVIDGDEFFYPILGWEEPENQAWLTVKELNASKGTSEIEAAKIAGRSMRKQEILTGKKI